MDFPDAAERWYTIQNANAIDSPALVVYLERVQENIRLLKTMIDDVQRLRPHVKTHKTAEAALLLLHAGIQKFKCATIAEAEMLARINAPDVLLAYQPVGPKVMRFISLLKQYSETRFSCLVDHANAARYLSEQATAAQVQIRVFIDLNVGMNRTGILPDEQAVDLYSLCAALPGLEPVGLHVYDGHISDTDISIRKQKCDAAFTPVQYVHETLLQKGFPEPVVVAGGSGTFPIHAQRSKIECSPGTFIYWDAGYRQLLPEQPFQPAALLLTRIISLPDEKTICTDLGHKAVAAENVLNRRVLFLSAPGLQCMAQSEEHLVLAAPKEHCYKIGDVLYALPFHICPTCALYDRALVVMNKVATTEWKIVSRDRKISI